MLSEDKFGFSNVARSVLAELWQPTCESSTEVEFEILMSNASFCITHC